SDCYSIIGIGVGIGDCSLATNMSRIGSDSYQYYPNWYIQTSGFPNGSVFITSQHRSCPVCALRRENALAQSSPLYRSQGHVSRRGAQAESRNGGEHACSLVRISRAFDLSSSPGCIGCDQTDDKRAGRPKNASTGA